MRPGGVVVLPPRFDQDLCLAQIEEDFPRQQLVAQLAVEAFAVAVFPWAARLVLSDECEPVSDSRARAGLRLREVPAIREGRRHAAI